MADVDASRMVTARAASGGRLSYVSIVVKAAADVVAGYPLARSLLLGGSRPRLAEIGDVNVKVLFDKTADGQRCVISGTVCAAQRLSAGEIQDVIAYYKDCPVDSGGPFRRTRLLQRFPPLLGHFAYAAAMRDPARRAAIQGVLSVTSVGQEPVRAIFPMISETIGFGVGRIADCPVVRDGELRALPVLTLSLTFDHRVLDGAMAAEVLGRVKERLEEWDAK